MAQRAEPGPGPGPEEGATDTAGHGRHWLVWKEIPVSGRPVAYGEAGSGPPLVFLHGWGLDHRAYKRALSRLVAAGVRVVAPALPGFGGTAPLRGPADGLGSYGRWLAAFLDAIGIQEPVLVVGHSFGGGVGITFAHAHPDRVRGLVLVNSVGGSAWSTHGSVLRSMAERPLWDWGLHFQSDIWPLAQARRVLPVIVSEALPNLFRNPGSFIRSAQLARTANLLPELQALKVRGLPIVVLWGARDQIITRASFEQMCAALGDPPTVTVDGPHTWLIADPDEFGEVMTNVVDVVSQAGSGINPGPGPGRRSPDTGPREAAS